MSEHGKAVFLSYASQDAEAAKRIADALRSSGVEVWFDAEGGLEHGDEWDAKIRRQIKECVLFIPLISVNTQARDEGYFRIEWDLAAERARGIASGVAFILPVVIDGTKEQEALVPDRFRAVQWTKLPGGVVPAEVLQRFLKLWSHRTEVVRPGREQGAGSTEPEAGRLRPTISAGPGWKTYAGLAMACLALAAGAVAWLSRREPAPAATGSVRAPALSEARQLVAKARALFEKDSNNRDGLNLAEDYCQKALKLDPDDAEVWAAYAELSGYFIGSQIDTSPARMEQARMQSERALQLAPKSPEARFAKASYLRRLDGASLVEAEKILRELAVETPDDPRVLISLGKVIWGALGAGQNLARADEALGWFDRAAAIPAGRAEAMGQRGWLLWNLDRYEEADAAIDEALRASDGAALMSIKVLIALARGDLMMARTYFAKMPEEMTRRDQGAAMGADLWLRLHEPEKCLGLLDSVPRDFLTSTNWTGPTDLLRGLAYQQAGRTAAARSAWSSALRVVDQRLAANPRGRALLLARAQLLALLGDREAAGAALRLYEEIYPDSPTQGRMVRYDPLAVYALLESPDRVLALLEDRFGRVVAGQLRTDYRFEMLRGHPRFEALVQQPVRPDVTVNMDDKSVAVLAFANLSSDKEQEYFSDGISEELLNVLAKVPGLKVSARTSAFYFKGKEVPIPEIAKQLGVAFVVEGSVRKQGDKVRITAQLIKAADGFHVWSDTFTRDLKDIFAVQDEIAGLIAKTLSLKLGATSATAAIDPESYGLFLAGRQALDLRTVESFDRAEALFTQVIERAPKFARAYAARAEARYLRANVRREIGLWPQRNSRVFDVLAEDVEVALQLEPDLPEAVAVRGLHNNSRYRGAEAERDYRRAIELNPNYALVHMWLGIRFWAEGRVPEAKAALLRACELDPMFATIAATYSAFLHDAGFATEALAQGRRAVALQPNGLRPNISLAHALVLNGQMDEAVAIARRELTGGGSWQAGRYIRVLALAGARAEAERIYREKGAGYDAQSKASALAALGRWSEFFEAWQVESLNSQAPFPLYDIIYDPVRKDPRFLAVIKEIGMLEAHDRAQAWRAAHSVEKPKP